MRSGSRPELNCLISCTTSIMLSPMSWLDGHSYQIHRSTVSHEQYVVEAMLISSFLGILARLLGSVVRHRKSLALVAIIFLVRTIKCFKECFLLVRSIFLNLRLWQIANRFVRHNLSPPRPWIWPKGICGQPISHAVEYLAPKRLYRQHRFMLFLLQSHLTSQKNFPEPLKQPDHHHLPTVGPDWIS